MTLAEGQVRVLQEQLLGTPAVRLHVGDQLNDLRVGGPDPGNALLVQGDVLVGGRRRGDHGIFPSAAILAPRGAPDTYPRGSGRRLRGSGLPGASGATHDLGPATVHVAAHGPGRAVRSVCGGRGGSAAEQTGDAEVLVDLVPVNAHSVTQQLPAVALGLRCMEKSRE